MIDPDEHIHPAAVAVLDKMIDEGYSLGIRENEVPSERYPSLSYRFGATLTWMGGPVVPGSSVTAYGCTYGEAAERLADAFGARW